MPLPESRIPVELRDRYGLPRPKTGLVIAGGLLASLVVLLLGFVGHYIVTHQVDGRVTSFTVRSASQVDVAYYISHAPLGPATCVVRAQNGHHVDVGYAYVTTQVTNTSATQTGYVLNTTERATTVEVLACASGLNPSRPPQPQFYPGQPAPAQSPPGRVPGV